MTFEKRYVRKDGVPTWANVTSSVKRDSQGRAEYFITVAEVIDARVAAEQALRESEARYRALFESIQTERARLYELFKRRPQSS